MVVGIELELSVCKVLTPVLSSIPCTLWCCKFLRVFFFGWGSTPGDAQELFLALYLYITLGRFRE